MTDITCIGEVLIDLTQTGTNAHGVPQFSANPGGAPANVAVAASRLGARTAFIGKTGRDGFGAYLRRVLEENRVAADGCALRTHPRPWRSSPCPRAESAISALCAARTASWLRRNWTRAPSPPRRSCISVP